MFTNHNFLRERRAEADSNRGLPAYHPNAIPLGQTGSQFSPEPFRLEIQFSPVPFGHEIIIMCFVNGGSNFHVLMGFASISNERPFVVK